MPLTSRSRMGPLVVAALAMALLPCAAAGAAVTGSAVGAFATLPGGGLTEGPPPGADPEPTGSSPSAAVPSESDVSKAQEAAAAAAEEVADITAQIERAEARLATLQRAVAEATAADERAQQQLSAAEAAVRQATARLAAARRAREAADRALSGNAALIYMQGSDLQNLTALLLTPPDVMSDLAVVLDHNAHRVRGALDAATSAAVDAASRERLLVSARKDRETAVEAAAVKRTAAEQQAARAGAEAARLAAQQEALTARLAELERGAADLAELREAASRRGPHQLLGVQALGSAGSGPRAAQELARSMMASYGWDDEAQFTCLVELWHAESGWSWSATNTSSGAYGIPQALPGWKMSSAGSDWLTNPATQITWGLDYIASVYGSPCQAHDRFLARTPHWY